MELAVLMNNKAPGTTLLSELVAKSVAGSSLTEIAEHLAGRAEFTSAYPSFQTATEFANEWLVSALPEASASLLAECVTIVEGYINGGGSIPGLVVVVQQVLTDAANADGALKTHVDNFSNKVTVATYHTITQEAATEWAIPATVTSDATTVAAANAAVDIATAPAPVPPNTIALTTGLDTSTGTAGVDTFTAVETAVTTPATDTLTTGDNLSGGAGIDALSIAVSGTPAAGITSGVVTSGIEELKVFNNGTAVYEVDAALMSGFTDVYVSGGTFKTTIDDVDSLANLHLLSTNVDAEISTTAAAVVGTADAATILSNSSAQTGAVTATYDGIEVINFNAAGVTGIKTATVDTSLTLDSDQLEKVVVSGDSAANITVDLTGADLETQTSEFDASAAGGVITAHVTKGDSATVKVTMSKQGDWLDYNGALASTATLDGGEGTDTLELDTDLAYSSAATAQAGAGVSNFETLRLASGTDVDERALTGNAGITSVTSVAGGSYTKSTALASATQLSSGTFTTTVATDGTADALTMNLVGAGVASVLSAANVETLTLTSGGTAANSLTMSAAQSADLTSLTASGTQSLTATISGTSLATVDASGITGVGNTFTLAASASAAAMTVTASAVRPTVSATGLANTITTGGGADTVTGGAYRDVITTNDGADTVTSGDGNDTITTGRGADTITAGNGDLNITAGISNDTVTVGNGTNIIDLGSGNDTLTAGNGKNTVTLGAGDDTVTTGSGADVVIMSDYDNDDTIDLGAGSDTLLLTALASTGAYAVAGNFVDIAASVTPKLSNIENLYLQHTTLAGNDSVATQETIDLTSSTGLGNLYLDIVDGDTNDDSVYVITNFSGSAIHLSQTSGESPDVLNIDGTGQTSLTVKGSDFNATAGTDVVITQVDNVTIDSYETVTVSGVKSLVADQVFGSITADGSDSITVKTDGSTATLGLSTTTTGAISADSAQTITLSAASNGELVTGALTSTSAAVDTISLTTGDDGVLDTTSVDVTGSDLSALTITNGIGGRIDLDGSGDTTPITADSITAATITLGAASNTGLDLLYGGTTTITQATGSTLDLDSVGVAATTSSTTLTGRGTLQGALDILGNATFNFSGLETGASVVLDVNDDTGNKVITTNRYNAQLDMNATGGDTLTTGSGIDVILGDGGGGKTAFASANATVSSPTGASTLTVAYYGRTTAAFSVIQANANATATEYATGIKSAVAADPILSGILTATGSTIAVQFTSKVEGTYAALPIVTITPTGGTAAYITGTATAGSEGAGGADTITSGDGIDFIYGGAGIDSISAGGGADIINAAGGGDSISGGGGLDTFFMSVGDASPTVAGTGAAGTVTGFDKISDYALGTAATLAETIDLLVVTDAVLGNSAGVNGTDGTLTIDGAVVKSHAIASGIFTLDESDTFAAAMNIDTAPAVAAIVQYLLANDLGNAGDSAAFVGNGNTYVYTQTTNTAGQTVNLIELTGVTGTSMSASNATTAGLIDLGA
jgi:Ca2+-binding RTX toxin-like protein